MDEHTEQPTSDEVVEVTRRSPAGRAVRWVLVLAVASVILWVLFTTVFPWIERSLSTPTMG